MAESVFDNIWDTLVDYDFTINQDIIKDVICVICKKIMVDPYTGYCGCHYCSHCIKEYVINNKKHCPGAKKECFNEYLAIGINVFKDLNVSYRIANINVKCPSEFCSFTTKLKDIKNHIRFCNMKAVECPFLALGCSMENVTEIDLNEHLLLDSVLHSRLLIEYISHLRNDFNELRQTIQMKEKEINELKEISEKDKVEIKELNIKTEKQKKKMVKFYEHIKINQNKIIELFEIDEERKKEIKKLKEEVMKIKTEKMKSQENEERNEIMIIEMKDDKNMIKNEDIREYRSMDFLDNWKELKTVKKKNVIEEKFDLLGSKNYERSRSSENRNNKINERIKIVKRGIAEMNCFSEKLSLKPDFIWQIKEFSKKSSKVGGVLYSSSFYIDHYKLCLRVNTDSLFVRNLSFYVHLVKGKYDEKLEWPMKHTILVSLYNQDDLKAHECWICNYYDYKDKSLFCRPTTDKNSAIYCGGISLTDIKETQGLIVRDCVIVRCALT